jgi:predicted ester cyclase
MDTIMAVQEHVAVARSLLDLYNSRQSDPAWLDKCMAAFAADAEIIDVPSGAILRGLDGYKRIVLFFAESLPDSRAELTNAFATEDQVVLEGTSWWTTTGPLQLPSGALPATERSGKSRFCFVLQIRNGKIASFHSYYDMMTMLEQRGLAPATGQATE